jgi:hypothetical protein
VTHRLLQTVDEPYGPRLQKIIRYAEALRLNVCWCRGRGFRICAPYVPDYQRASLHFRVANGRMHLLPRPEPFTSRR